MRLKHILPALGVMASLVLAVPSPSGAKDFQIKGTWAADGKACSESALFVEFDGSDILAYAAEAPKARIAANYATAVEGGHLTVSLTDVASKASDEWKFLVHGEDAIRLDSRFFAASDLMKLTRCPTPKTNLIFSERPAR
jgi:hypothetical protein